MRRNGTLELPGPTLLRQLIAKPLWHEVNGAGEQSEPSHATARWAVSATAGRPCHKVGLLGAGKRLAGVGHREISRQRTAPHRCLSRCMGDDVERLHTLGAIH